MLSEETVTALRRGIPILFILGFCDGESVVEIIVTSPLRWVR